MIIKVKDDCWFYWQANAPNSQDRYRFRRSHHLPGGMRNDMRWKWSKDSASHRQLFAWHQRLSRTPITPTERLSSVQTASNAECLPTCSLFIFSYLRPRWPCNVKHIYVSLGITLFCKYGDWNQVSARLLNLNIIILLRLRPFSVGIHRLL